MRDRALNTLKGMKYWSPKKTTEVSRGSWEGLNTPERGMGGKNRGKQLQEGKEPSTKVPKRFETVKDTV